LTNYVSRLREFYDARIIDKAIIFLLEVKKIVKRQFPPDYFYDVHEVIEEARAYGAGIVVPHPSSSGPSFSQITTSTALRFGIPSLASSRSFSSGGHS